MNKTLRSDISSEPDTSAGQVEAHLPRVGSPATVFTVALIVVSALLFAASLLIGSRMVPIGELANGIFGAGHSDIKTLIWQLRAPRTILAYAVGVALALAGVLAQAWTRNPLADPGFIGITAGASFAVAAGSVFGLATSMGSRTVLALFGSTLAAVVVIIVSRRSTNPLALILTGIGVDASLRAITTLVGLHSTAVLDSMRRWTVGSTFGRGYDEAALACAGAVGGLVVALFAARSLDLEALGHETSLSLGRSAVTTYAISAIGVIALAGIATAAAGPVAFVGFAAPHFARHIVGPSVSRLVVPTALLGGILVLSADIVGRLVLRPGELEMSIVLAVIGAPALILATRRGVGWRKGAF